MKLNLTTCADGLTANYKRALARELIEQGHLIYALSFDTTLSKRDLKRFSSPRKPPKTN